MKKAGEIRETESNVSVTPRQEEKKQKEGEREREGKREAQAERERKTVDRGTILVEKRPSRAR